MTGDEFKAIRAQLGCTGADFARALGYDGSPQTLRTTIYQFETGRREIPETVGRLAIMLGTYGVPNERWFDGGDMIDEVFNKKSHRAKRREV